MGFIRCYGYSDDTAIIEGTVNTDMGCFFKKDGINAKAVLKDGNGEGCVIYFVYDGEWMVGIKQFDEEEPLPSWVQSARFTQGTDNDSCRYSVVLTMDVPDDITIKWEGEDE